MSNTNASGFFGSHHQPTFDFDEGALLPAVEMLEGIIRNPDSLMPAGRPSRIAVMPFSNLDYLECSAGCMERYYADKVNGLCCCGAPLFARYRLSAVKASVTRKVIAARPPSLWRYHELLPVRDPGRVVSLGEGMTPLLPLPGFGKKAGVPRLLVKDEGLIPTGTFKARGAAVGISRAIELGVRGIAMSTNGNAGAAWSAYAARAGIRSLIAMPEDAPDIMRRECVVTGAELYLVRGRIGDAGGIITTAVAESAGTLADVSTLKEPYRLEGKKTMGYEIVEQLGWRCPDVIVYPTGVGSVSLAFTRLC